VLGHQETLDEPNQIPAASAIEPPKPCEKAPPVGQAGTKGFAGANLYKKLPDLVRKTSL